MIIKFLKSQKSINLNKISMCWWCEFYHFSDLKSTTTTSKSIGSKRVPSKEELEFWSRKMRFYACTNIPCALPKFTTVAQAHSKVSTTCTKVRTKYLFHQLKSSTWIEIVCKNLSKMQNVCKIFVSMNKVLPVQDLSIPNKSLVLL